LRHRRADCFSASTARRLEKADVSEVADRPEEEHERHHERQHAKGLRGHRAVNPLGGSGDYPCRHDERQRDQQSGKR